MILTILFLAGPRFDALATDGNNYIHDCGKRLYRLSTLEEMVHHIETHHHRREMATKVISASTQTMGTTYVDVTAPTVDPSSAYIATNDTNRTSPFQNVSNVDPGLKVITDYLDTLKIRKADNEFISCLELVIIPCGSMMQTWLFRNANVL